MQVPSYLPALANLICHACWAFWSKYLAEGVLCLPYLLLVPTDSSLPCHLFLRHLVVPGGRTGSVLGWDSPIPSPEMGIIVAPAGRTTILCQIPHLPTMPATMPTMPSLGGWECHACHLPACAVPDALPPCCGLGGTLSIWVGNTFFPSAGGLRTQAGTCYWKVALGWGQLEMRTMTGGGHGGWWAERACLPALGRWGGARRQAHGMGGEAVKTWRRKVAW